MKNLFLLSFLILNFTVMLAQEKTIYDYKVETIDGETISLSEFKGKKIMIVNVASKCGYTPQYEQLQEVYEKYKDENFVILGFPSNEFMNQEPGSNEEIVAFCQKNYGVTFPMFSKINVKKGKKQHPLYEYLTTKSLNGFEDSKIKWNFQKYLIGTNGKIEEIHYSRVVPNDPKIIEWIEK